MGLSIHYQGSFKHAKDLPLMIEEVVAIAKINHWKYFIFENEFPDSAFSTTPEMPFAASSEVATRRCGFDGPAILRTTDERSKLNTRSYSAVCKLSAHKPACLA